MINRVNLILTHKCNLNCKHCYMDLQSRKHISDKEIKERAKGLIKKLHYFGINEIMFTGGEIFTSPFIKDILKFSKNFKIKNIVFTNGFDFDYSCLKYIDQVNVSLDGNEKNHNQMRGNKNSYKKVLELLEKLKTSNIWTCVQMSIYEKNLKDIEDVAYLLSNYLNVRTVHLNGIIAKGNAINNNYCASDDINMQIIKKIKDLYRITKYHIQFKTSLISNYDYINNYVNEVPRIPVWIDLIDGDFYLIKNDLEFSGKIEEFQLEIIEDMYLNLQRKLINKKLEKNNYINIEKELNSLN